MDISPEHSKTLVYTSLAGIGGVLGYIYRETKAGRKVILVRVLLTGALAAFIGYHMIMVYHSMGLPDKLIGALNGLTALLGVEFMMYIVEKLVLKKLGITYEDRVLKALVDAGWTPPDSGAASLSNLPLPEPEAGEGEVGASGSGPNRHN